MNQKAMINFIECFLINPCKAQNLLERERERERGREGERERGREGERERQRQRETETETETERETERDRERQRDRDGQRQRVFFLKHVTKSANLLFTCFSNIFGISERKLTGL